MKAPAKKKAVPAKPVPKSAPKSATKKKPSPKAGESSKAGPVKTANPVSKQALPGVTSRKPKAGIRAKVAPKKSPKPVPKPASKSATKVAGARVKTSAKKKPAAVRPATRKPLASSRGTGPRAVKPTAKATKSPAVVKPVVAPAAVAPVKPAVAPKPAPIKPTPVTTTKSFTASATAKPVTPPKVAVASKPAKVPLRSPAKAAKSVAAKPAQALIELPAMPQAAKKKLTLEIPALLLEGDHTPGAQPGGPGSRYALGQAARTGAATEDEPALPEAYGTRKLWLVPRDPQWLYAHWDLDAAQLHEYNRLSRDGHLLLRIFDAADAASFLTEIHVHPESRSWFAHVGKGGGRYFAVLGFRDKTGEWNEINRSEAVGTPPDSLSPEVEVQFVTLPSTVPVTVPAPMTPEPATEPPSATVAEVIEAVREYLAGEPVLAQAIATARTAQPTDLSEPVELPPPAEFAHWTPAQQQALAQVISMEAVRQVWAGSQTSSLALAESLEARRQKDLASVAAIPVGAPGVGAVNAPGAISSPHGGAPAERSFWFNVNAELVVYGATEPNAKVVIGGRLIRLRQDGTFSYRFALPDGWYGLPISATSADGEETRDATLRFMRETEYRGDVGAHPQDAALKTPAPEHTS